LEILNLLQLAMVEMVVTQEIIPLRVAQVQVMQVVLDHVV
jgi:hypothetical protein